MARFICCTTHAKDGGGDPVWINVDLVTAIEVDKFGLGSKITFAGHETPHFYVQEKPHEIFDLAARGAKSSTRT